MSDQCVRAHRLTQVCADCAQNDVQTLVAALGAVLKHLPPCHVPGCGKPFLKVADLGIFATDDDPEHFCDEHAPETSFDFGCAHPDKPAEKLREALAVYERYASLQAEPSRGGGSIPTVWDRVMDRPVKEAPHGSLPETRGAKIVRVHSTLASKTFWEAVEKSAAGVREWPDWKKVW